MPSKKKPKRICDLFRGKLAFHFLTGLHRIGDFLRRQAEPDAGFQEVGGCAQSVLITLGEVKLSHSHPLTGGLSEPLHRGLLVFWSASSGRIHDGQIVLCVHVPLPGSLEIPVPGFLFLHRHALADLVQ